MLFQGEKGAGRRGLKQGRFSSQPQSFARKPFEKPKDGTADKDGEKSERKRKPRLVSCCFISLVAGESFMSRLHCVAIPHCITCPVNGLPCDNALAHLKLKQSIQPINRLIPVNVFLFLLGRNNKKKSKVEASASGTACDVHALIHTNAYAHTPMHEHSFTHEHMHTYASLNGPERLRT